MISGEITDADLDEVARLLGHALFQAQYLEFMLVSLFGVSASRSGHAENREEMRRRFRQSVGMLVRDLDEIDVTGGLADELRSALHLRNDLVHRFYKHYAPLVESRAVFQQETSYLRVALLKF